MANPRKDDDELLILPDDGDEGITISEDKTPKSDEELITFDEEVTSDAKDKGLVENVDKSSDVSDLDFNFDEGNNETKEEKLDLNIDSETSNDMDLNLDSLNSNDGDTDSLLDNKEDNLNESTDGFNLEDDSTKTSGDSSSLSSSAKVLTMSEILDETIKEFNEREAMIQSDLDTRNTHISKLEAELKDEKQQVSSLKDEKQALEKNRKAIEDMKNDSTKPKKVAKK